MFIYCKGSYFFSIYKEANFLTDLSLSEIVHYRKRNHGRVSSVALGVSVLNPNSRFFASLEIPVDADPKKYEEYAANSCESARYSLHLWNLEFAYFKATSKDSYQQ